MSETMTKMTIADITPESYRNADVSGKSAMRRMVDSTIKSEMDHDASEIDIVAVQALFRLQAALVPVRAEKSEKDYVALIARKAAVYHLASQMMLDGTVRPDGVPDETDLSGLSTAFQGIMDNPDDSVIADATDVAGRKVTKGANQYNVGDVIVNAFDDVKSGTFLTIRQICAKSDYPHDGAVAARLFPKSGTCTVDGIIPVDRVPGVSVRGARKM